MSFIYRNALVPSVLKWNALSRIHHRFKKVWNDDGTVYDKKLVFYQGDSYLETKELTRFLNGLGTSWEEFTSQSIDNEIEQVWFYLDPVYEWDGSFAGDTRVGSTSSTTQLVVPTAEEIASIFNETFSGKTITVTVEYGGSNMRYVDSHELGWDINEAGVIEAQPLDTVAIRETLDSNPWYYFANSKHLDYTKDSNQFQLYNDYDVNMPKDTVSNPSNRLLGTTKVSCSVHGHTKVPGSGEKPKHELGAFALMTNGNMFTKVGDIHSERITTASNSLDGEAVTYVYSQDYTFNTADPLDGVIQDILSWYDTKPVSIISRRPVYTPVGTYREDLKYFTNDTIYKRALDSLQMYEDPYTGSLYSGVTNSLFQNSRLRVYESSMMRRSDFTIMISTCLQTDYEVEDAEWWEVVLAVFIVIIAIVVAIFSYNPGFIGLATSLGYGGMVLTIGMYVLSVIGGLSAQGLVKIIGMFAQIVGILASVAGFMAAIEAAGKQLAAKTLQEAGMEATETAIAQEMLSQTFADQLGAYLNQALESITTKLTEFVTFSGDDVLGTVIDGLDFISQGLEFQQDKEMEKLQAEYEELEEEQRKYDQENLSNMLKNPSAVWLAMEDRITSYDALTEVDRKTKELVSGDKSFLMWNSNVNTV